MTRGRSVPFTILLTGALALGWPAPARAQSASDAEPPLLSIAAGGGVSHSLHGDLDFVAGLWEVSARGRLGPRTALEGSFAEWHHTERTELRDVPLHGPDGLIGHAGLIAQRTTRVGRSMEVNLVALGRTGGVTVSAGGGVGILTMRRDFRQIVSDCTSSLPNACNESRSEVTNASLTFQGLAGLDVHLTSRVSAYGQFKFVAPTEDLGSSELRFTAGVRVGIL
jgi:hypothetical protein